MTTDLTFTERTAALMRLPQARILPAALLVLVTDMAAAHDANAAKIAALEAKTAVLTA